jgi:hypothetical protein
MISNYSRFYNVATYLRRYTHQRIVLVMGVPTLAGLFDEQHYRDLEGGILEAFGKLFAGGVKLYVQPWQRPETGECVTAANFQAPPPLRHLYAHLLGTGAIEPLAG